MKLISKARLITSIKFLISILLIYLVMENIAWGELFVQVEEISLITIACVVGIGFLQLLLNCYSQIELFSIFFDSQPGFGNQLQNNIISVAYLLAIPGFAAPDVYLTYYYGKFFGNYPKTISALLLNRLSGLLIFFMFSIFSIIYYSAKLTKLLNFNFAAGDLILIAASIMLILILLFWILKRAIPSKLKRYFEFIKGLISKIIQNKSHFIRFLGLKTIWYLVSVLGRVFLAYLIGFELGVLELASIIIIVNFLGSLPISISGLGVREGSYITLMGIFGVVKEKALLLSFLDFSILLVWAMVGLIILGVKAIPSQYKNKIFHSISDK